MKIAEIIEKIRNWLREREKKAHENRLKELERLKELKEIERVKAKIRKEKAEIRKIRRIGREELFNNNQLFKGTIGVSKEEPTRLTSKEWKIGYDK